MYEGNALVAEGNVSFESCSGESERIPTCLKRGGEGAGLGKEYGQQVSYTEASGPDTGKRVEGWKGGFGSRPLVGKGSAQGGKG